jgi:hypothetical protein
MNSTQMILSRRSSSPNQITTSIKMLKAITAPSRNSIPHPSSFGQTGKRPQLQDLQHSWKAAQQRVQVIKLEMRVVRSPE